MFSRRTVPLPWLSGANLLPKLGELLSSGVLLFSLTTLAQRSKPDIIVCDSETCRWNIEALTSVKTIHPVQLLTRALNSGC